MSALCLNRMDRLGGVIHLFLYLFNQLFKRCRIGKRRVRMCFWNFSVSDELLLKNSSTHTHYLPRIFSFVGCSFPILVDISPIKTIKTSCLDWTKLARRCWSLFHTTMALSLGQQYLSLIIAHFCMRRPPNLLFCKIFKIPWKALIIGKAELTEAFHWRRATNYF